VQRLDAALERQLEAKLVHVCRLCGPTAIV
jgi:hypothetical protein